jgi:hypothetical protein
LGDSSTASRRPPDHGRANHAVVQRRARYAVCGSSSSGLPRTHDHGGAVVVVESRARVHRCAARVGDARSDSAVSAARGCTTTRNRQQRATRDSPGPMWSRSCARRGGRAAVAGGCARGACTPNEASDPSNSDTSNCALFGGDRGRPMRWLRGHGAFSPTPFSPMHATRAERRSGTR